MENAAGAKTARVAFGGAAAGILPCFQRKIWGTQSGLSCEHFGCNLNCIILVVYPYSMLSIPFEIGARSANEREAGDFAYESYRVRDCSAFGTRCVPAACRPM